MQTLNYRYNARGWLTNINNPTLLGDGGLTSNEADQFGMELKYYDATSSRKQYNGNIATATVKTGNVSTASYASLTYDYGYDKLNRLTDAVSSAGLASKDGFTSEYITYNNMGNITNLGRYDNISGVRTQIDTLSYTYTANRHTRIDDASAYTGNAGFINTVSQNNEYTYDGNGNQLKDLNKGLSGFSYNMLNLPQTITKTNGNTTVYVYDAMGRKLRKLYTAGATTTITEYVAGVQYDYTGSTPVIAFLQTEEGRARNSSGTYKYEYDLKDHLGNTRLTTTWDASDPVNQLTPQNLQHTDYYAFGYTIQSSQTVVASPKNQYLYNGKELQEETGLYDYGARLYDPVIGRWNAVDPLVEAGQENTSPYGYVFDDPIKNTDPDGRSPDDGFVDGIKQGFVGYFTGIAHAVMNPLETATKMASPKALLESSLDGATMGNYSFAKNVAGAANDAVNGNYNTAGQFFGGKLAELSVVVVTEGVGKGLGVAKKALTNSLEKAVGAGIQDGTKVINEGGKGSANPKVSSAIRRGKVAHADFTTKVEAKGWSANVSMIDPLTGATVIADAITPGGQPLELKPNTPSGRAQGARQLPKYERATGKKGRVIYYDPNK